MTTTKLLFPACFIYTIFVPESSSLEVLGDFQILGNQEI